ncbi:MAG: hypothetical protein Q4G63_12460, partial [Bacteroidia bacterium]|nr:hypothetical protein [Bacteroidia bacterium]
INDPKLAFYVFQKQSEGEFNNAVLTPDFRVVNIPSHTLSYNGNSKVPIGTCPGFVIYKYDSKNDVAYDVKRYYWDTDKYISNDTTAVIKPVTIKTGANTLISLFYNFENNTGKPTSMIDIKYGEISDKLNSTDLLKIIMSNAEKGNPLKPVDFSKKNINTNEEGWKIDSGSGVAVDCNSANIKELLAGKLNNINKISESYTPSQVRQVLLENYSTCVFELLDISKRITILDILLNDNVDDGYWQFEKGAFSKDVFYLDNLILSTQTKDDRIKLLKQGFMANNYKWLQNLWNKISPKIFNNDVGYDEASLLIAQISGWVMNYYNELEIQPTVAKSTTTQFKDGGEVQVEYTYPLGTKETLLGIGMNEKVKTYAKPYSGRYYVSLPTNTLKALDADVRNGKVLFKVRYYTQEVDQIYEAGKGPKGDNVSENKIFEPFELMDMAVVGNFATLGYNDGDRFTIPAIIGVVIAKEFEDEQNAKNRRDILNGVVIAGAILAIPYTGGSSLVAISADLSVVSGLVAAADMVQNERIDNFSKEEREAYKETLEKWERFKAVVYTADAIGGGAVLARGLAKIESWESLFSSMKSKKDLLKGNARTIYDKIIKGKSIISKVEKVFNISEIKALTGVMPTGSKLTNLSFSNFTKAFDADFISSLGSKYADDLAKIRQGLDKGGNLTEGIVSEALRKQGYTVTKDIGKYGSNNGFDVVAYKGTLDNPTEILIIESKQFNQNKILDEFDGIKELAGYDEASGTVLNAANPETGLPTQMSTDWTFKHVADKLSDKGGDFEKLSNALENKTIVQRYVFAIDKSDGAGYFTKLSNNF